MAALGVERRAELVQALGRLSPAHRQVVTCRFLLDLDEAETAVVLGLARGTVKSRLHRALRRLSEVLPDPHADLRVNPQADSQPDPQADSQPDPQGSEVERGA